MFTQVDRTLDKSQGGLGVGLAIVKRLVEMHGGSVAAASPGVGKGSTFTIRVPQATSVAVESRTEEPRSGAAPQQRRRVLIADDNVDAADTLSMMLQLKGHDVRVVHEGQQAVRVAAEFQPHVVLLDIGMPELDGYEACQKIREQHSTTRPVIVAVTGWGHDQDKQRSQEAGFDAHLTKPIEPGALERFLERAEIRPLEA
jgi:CheY-like chemotaxis protein